MDDLKLQVLKPEKSFGVRHAQTAIMALTSFGIYALRISLSVTIVAMTGMDAKGMVPEDGIVLNVTSPYPVYDWDEQTQGLVLSSFFWGYMLTQVPAGVLTQRLGAHRFLTVAMLCTSIFCALLPVCAYIGGWAAVCVNRMLQGLTQGFVYPSIFAMMGLWIPTQERGRLSGFILGAQNMGPVIATPLAGWLSAYCGWPSVFYWYGAAGILITAVIFKFGADNPSSHKNISSEERAFIQATVDSSREKVPIPWRDLLLSRPAWAVILTMALQGGVFLTFLTKIPTYLSSVLKFNIKENGVLTAMPYLASWLLSFVFSWSCDWLVEKNYLTLTQARKVFNSISHVGSGITMILLGYCTSTSMSVILLASSIGLMAASYPGAQSNFMDLAPNMSGTIFAVSNFLSAVCGVAGPIIVSFIVTEKGSVIQWRMVYFVCAGVMFLSNLLFVVSGSAEVQPWNYPKRDKKFLRTTEEERQDLFPEKGANKAGSEGGS